MTLREIGSRIPFLRSGQTTFAVVCAVLGAAVACSVMVGWAVGDRMLVQVGPTFAPMQMNTALCFLGGSIALVVVASGLPVIRSPGGRMTLLATGSLLVGTAGLTLVQYGTGLDFGIDELIVDAYILTRTSHPGRMSPWTAIGFIAMGSVILIGRATPRPGSLAAVTMALLTSFVGLLATTVLVLYVLEFDPALGAVSSTRMAVHTATLFWILAAGAGAVLSLGSARSRRAFQWVPVLVGLVISLTVRQGLVDRENAVMRDVMGEWLHEIAVQSEALLEQRFEALDRMAFRVAAGAYSSDDIWQSDGRFYAGQVLEDNPIGLVDAELRVIWATPDPIGALDRYLGTEEARLLRESTRAAGATRMSPPLVDEAAPLRSLVLTPIPGEGEFRFVASLLEPIVAMSQGPVDEGYALEVRLADHPILVYDAPTVGASIQDRFEIGGQPVVLSAALTEGRIASSSSRLPGIILVAGLLFTAMLGSVQYSANGRARSEARFRALLESAPDAGLIVDEEGRILQVNSRAETLLDRTAEDLAGQRVGTLGGEGSTLWLPPPNWDWNEAFEVEVIAAGGRSIPVEINASPIQTEDGLLVSLAMRDVSEWHAMVGRLRESDRLKSDFVSTVSHEMRTPLTIIREFTSLVHDGSAGEINDEQHDFLDTVIRNCDRLTGLVGDLLELARLESGKYRMERQQTDLRALLERCVADFEPVAAAEGIFLMLDVQSDLPDVLGDGDRITQVLVNLMGNAVKFTPSGGAITVTASVRGSEVEVAVEDTGIGIAEEHQAMIFGAFVQVDRADGPGQRGTGLGLNVARQIVELHGGRLDLTSRLGEGSRFYFTLPALEGDILSGFLAPHLRRRQVAPAPLTLLLLRTGGEGCSDRMEDLSEAALAIQRVGRDETLLVRPDDVLAVALEADRAGAVAFLGRLQAGLPRSEHPVEYFLIQASTTGSMDLPRLSDVAGADTWRTLS